MSELSPLTQKQVDYIRQSFSCWLNFLEGGKRGSKNVVNVLAWCANLETHKNRIHLAAGVSVATAKINIVDCDGFGLTYYFAGRYKEGKYKDRDCLYVQTKTGEKVILISGGGKSGDEKLIKGNTYGTAMVTEMNECHPDFIREVFDRTLSSTDRKIFGDWNPKPPTHWFYADIFDFHWNRQQENPAYGLNYAHTTIADNMSISGEQLRAVLATYDKNTVWYKRDILGLRAAAEGLIFPQFANNPGKWIIPEPAHNYLRLFIGVDYGGTKAKSVFVLTGIRDGAAGPEVHFIDCHKIFDSGAGVGSDQIQREYREFFLKAVNRFGMVPHVTNSEHWESLRVDLKNAVRAHNHNVRFVDKSTIALPEWFRKLNALFNLGMLKIVASCSYVIESFKGLLYNPKADEDEVLDDNITCDVDTYDASRYAIVDVVKDWTRRGLIGVAA